VSTESLSGAGFSNARKARCVLIEEDSANELGAAPRTGLPEDGFEMILNGVRRKAERGCDFLRREPLGTQFRDLALTL
jgi:hypothetical protein